MIQARDYEPTFSGSWLCDRSRKTKRKIYSEFIALDTETAHNHDEDNPVGWVYQWCFAIGDDIVIGRTPSELMDALERVTSHVGADEHNHIICYVHNLSYDITYLSKFLTARFGSAKMLAIANHKFITYTVGGLEFRCSYKLSNRSLEKFGADLNTKHRKLVGAIDYDIIHTQQEELSPIDWDYQIEDVLTLQECIKKQLSIYNDTTATVPLTSTGYVRRECRKHYREDRRNRKRFLNGRINAHVYALLRRAFAGGLTHGNRFYMEETIEGKIAHRDFTSHYPSCQKCFDFPIGRFALYSSGGCSLETLEELKKNNCILCEIFLRNPHIKSRKITLPVISSAKAYEGALSRLKIDADNGRILNAEGLFSLVVTELDLYWILRQYDYTELYIGEVYIAKRGKLPKYMRDSVDEFFFGKSDVKEKIKQEQDEDKKAELELDLMKKKNALNGIYGMSATQLIRDSFEIDEAGNWSTKTPDDPQKELTKYFSSENSFVLYQWGVWTTATARYELLFYICDVIEKNGGLFLYADTDSCFYLTDDKVEEAVENENVRRRSLGDERGYYIDTENGKRVYYNQFTFEEFSEEFRFVHAKCYAYVSKGRLKCVIAGVSPYEDATRKYSREEELGEIDNLADGFVFRRCGGTKALYDDARPIGEYYHNGQKQEVASACIITKTEKTINSEISLWDKFTEWEVD